MTESKDNELSLDELKDMSGGYGKEKKGKKTDSYTMGMTLGIKGKEKKNESAFWPHCEDRPPM
tara:strand:- start:104 stop:292 length:189 start_codon:yes stop_codon:yes gene_type:complete